MDGPGEYSIRCPVPGGVFADWMALASTQSVVLSLVGVFVDWMAVINFPLVFGSRFVNRMNTRLNICCLDGPGEDSIRRPVPGGGL